MITYSKEMYDRITPNWDFCRRFKKGDKNFQAYLFEEFYQLDNYTFNDCLYYIEDYKRGLSDVCQSTKDELTRHLDNIIDILKTHKTDILNLKDLKTIPSFFKKYEVETLHKAITNILATIDGRYINLLRNMQKKEGATKQLNYWKNGKIVKDCSSVSLKKLFGDEINKLDKEENPQADKPLLDNWEISLPHYNELIKDGDDLILPYYYVYMGAWGTRSAGEHKHQCNYRLKNGYVRLQKALKESKEKYIANCIKEETNRLNKANSFLHEYDFFFNPIENRTLNSLNIILNHILPSVIASYTDSEVKIKDIKYCNNMAFEVERTLLRTMYMSPNNINKC